MRGIFLAVLLCFMAPAAFASNLHVRSDGLGVMCQDWTQANACTAANAEAAAARGDIIYAADGVYPATTFDVAVSSTTLISIKHATAAAHGTSTGWSDSMGDGTMSFASVRFSTAYWVFDGIAGGGPGSWTSGFGCAFTSSAGTTIDYVTIDDTVDYVTVRHCSFTQTGNVDVTPNNANAFFIGGNTGQDHLLLEYNYINNISGLPFFMRFGDNSIIQYNWIGHVCGVSVYDGDDHCEVVVEWGVNDLEFRYNYILESPSSGTFVHNYPGLAEGGYSTPSNRIHIYGNVFRGVYGGGVIVCNGEGGGGLPASPCYDWRVFNNTIAYLQNQTIAFYTASAPSTGSIQRNNILFGASTYTLYSVGNVDHDYNYYSGFVGGQGGVTGTTACTFMAAEENGYNGHYGGCDMIADTESGGVDKFVNSASGTTPEDFRLTQHLPMMLVFGYTPWPSAGIDVCTIMGVTCDATQTYDKDMFGNTRGADGTWDRGAMQFTPLASSITGIAPSIGAVGTTVAIVVTGSGTSWVNGVTACSFSGSGITVNSTTVSSVTSATCNITIASDATTGARTLTMTTGGDVVTTSFAIADVGARGTARIGAKLR